jgi:hypothetical protein
MADTAIAITAGAGTNVDTRTEGTNGNHRQVIVIGDPATNAGVAPVDATNGLAVQIIPALPAGTNAIGKLAANSGVDIGDVDVTSVIPGTGATNQGKAVDSVAGATDTGIALLAVRDDSLTTLTPADGDYANLRVSSTGALHVTGGGGGTEYTEDVAAAADPSGQMLMAVRRDTLSASEVSADGDNVAIKATSKGQAHVYAEISSTQLSDLGQTDAANSVSVVMASDYVQKAAQIDNSAFTVGVSYVMNAGFSADETSTDSVVEGDAGAARMTLDRKQIVAPQPHTQGGCTVIRKVDLDETPAVVKAARGQLYGFYVVNRTAIPQYLRFYNIAAASVTVGTSTIHLGPIEIPANASDHTAMIIHFPVGIEFDTAMSWAVTAGFADNDTAAPAANAVIANAFIK